MIRRLLNSLLAALLMTAGPMAAFAAAQPQESCCGEACPCPPPPRPTPPRAPGAAQAPVSATQVQTQVRRKAPGPEPHPGRSFAAEARPSEEAPARAADVPDPPRANRRQSQLGVFRK